MFWKQQKVAVRLLWIVEIMPLVGKLAQVTVEQDAPCGICNPPTVEQHDALISLIYLIRSMTWVSVSV